jgi:copper chaperone CopZ
MQIAVLKVQGMHDEAGAVAILHALETLSGVHNVRVSPHDQRVTVRFDETVVSSAQVSDALNQAGYSAMPQPAERAACCGGCCG